MLERVTFWATLYVCAGLQSFVDLAVIGCCIVGHNSSCIINDDQSIRCMHQAYWKPFALLRLILT